MFIGTHCTTWNGILSAVLGVFGDIFPAIEDIYICIKNIIKYEQRHNLDQGTLLVH